MSSTKASRFRSVPTDHQLYQPLYVVQVDPDAEWDLNVFNRVQFAGVVAELPGDGGVYGTDAVSNDKAHDHD